MKVSSRYVCVTMTAVLFQLVSISWSATECEVSLRSSKTKIVPFEPVGFILTIESHTNDTIKKVSSSWASFRFAKVHEGRHVKWRTYAPFGVHATLSPPTTLAIQPRQTITNSCLMHVGFNGDHVFNESGLFLVQAGTPFGSSNVVTIEVVEPDTIVPAVELISKSRLFMLFDHYSAQNMPTTEESVETLSVALKKLRTMPEAFPYNAWFSVCEYALMGMRTTHSTAKESMQIHHMRYLQAAKELPSPQKETLILAIASAQLEANNIDSARSTYSWLANNTKDVYFSCLARYQLGVLTKTFYNSCTNCAPTSVFSLDDVPAL